MIMFCKGCRIIYHTTCVAELEEILEMGSVKCPKCPSTFKLADELRPEEFNALTEDIKPVEKVKEKVVKVAKKGKTAKGQGSVMLSRENGGSHEVDLKSHFDAKLAEQYQLVNAKFVVEQRWSESKAQLMEAQKRLADTIKVKEEISARRAQITRQFTILEDFAKDVQGDKYLPETTIKNATPEPESMEVAELGSEVLDDELARATEQITNEMEVTKSNADVNDELAAIVNATITTDDCIMEFVAEEELPANGNDDVIEEDTLTANDYLTEVMENGGPDDGIDLTEDTDIVGVSCAEDSFLLISSTQSDCNENLIL
jgi:hypothetical protein